MVQTIPMIGRMPAVITKYGLKRSTIYRQIADGLWPSPIHLTARAVGFFLPECDAVMIARIRGESDDAIRELVRKLEAARQHAGIAAA